MSCLTMNPFYRHEQIILSAGNCDGFLPMCFLRESDALTVRYSPSGFLPLSGYRIERTQDALYKKSYRNQNYSDLGLCAEVEIGRFDVLPARQL